MRYLFTFRSLHEMWMHGLPEVDSDECQRFGGTACDNAEILESDGNLGMGRGKPAMGRKAAFENFWHSFRVAFKILKFWRREPPIQSSSICA
jgi:hypothetical protein